MGHVNRKRPPVPNLRRCERTRTCEQMIDDMYNRVSNSVPETDRILLSGATTILTSETESRRRTDLFKRSCVRRRATWREDSAADHREVSECPAQVLHRHTLKHTIVFCSICPDSYSSKRSQRNGSIIQHAVHLTVRGQES